MSLEQEIDIDTKRVKKIYNEAKEQFGEYVLVKIEDIIKFKSEILENRRKFILKRERELKNRLEKIEKSITELELERSRKYDVLNEKGALDSIKNSYDKYIEKKSYVDQYAGYIQQHDDYLSQQSSKKLEIEKDKKNITDDLKSSEEVVQDLRKLFLEILENAIFLDAEFSKSFFDINPKPGNKIKSLPFEIVTEIPKAEALGQNRLKLVAYDLMVFLNSLKKKRDFPLFLVHDGVFHGIFTKTVINSLNFMHKQLLHHPGSQYFLTFNENELSSNDGKYGKFEFDLNEVIVVSYSDKEDEMIFKRNIS